MKQLAKIRYIFVVITPICQFFLYAIYWTNWKFVDSCEHCKTIYKKDKKGQRTGDFGLCKYCMKYLPPLKRKEYIDDFFDVIRKHVLNDDRVEDLYNRTIDEKVNQDIRKQKFKRILK